MLLLAIMLKLHWFDMLRIRCIRQLRRTTNPQQIEPMKSEQKRRVICSRNQTSNERVVNVCETCHVMSVSASAVCIKCVYPCVCVAQCSFNKMLLSVRHQKIKGLKASCTWCFYSQFFRLFLVVRSYTVEWTIYVLRMTYCLQA